MNTAQEAGEEPDDESLPLDAEPEEEPAHMSSPRSNRQSRQSNRDSQEYPPYSGADAGLESEERLGKVIADNQRIAQEKRELQRQLDTLYDHHSKLQQRHDKTSDELTETKDRLTSILAGKTEYGAFKSDSAQSTIISTLETRLAASEEEADTLRKNNEVLRIRVEKTQSLQDTYDELKISHDKLLRKANAAEKYKQKLEASQSLETENNGLKSKIADLQAQLKQSDITNVGHVDMRREIDEYRRLLPAIEQERHELNEMKKRLEFEYHALEARHQDALEQLRRQTSTIEELQGRLQDYEEGVVPSTPKPNGDAVVIPDIESSDEEEEENDDSENAEEQKDPTEDTISETELSAIMTAMRAQANATSDRKLSRVLEKGMARYQKVVSHAQKQSMLIKELQGKVTDAETRVKEAEVKAKEKEKGKDLAPLPPVTPPPPPLQKAEIGRDERDVLENQLEESEKMVGTLRRELKLVTSAWYEQNSRVMQGQMPTGRSSMGGGRAPSSFLGKARRDVGNVMLGSSSKE